uniref:WH1 domain-containing protein n=1 Tax=Syphacia muris TaxID=451379 RepID=A0A158R5Q1_9BILA
MGFYYFSPLYVPIHVDVGCPVLKSRVLKQTSPQFLTPSSSSGSKNSYSPNDMELKNEGSAWLTYDENQNIFKLLGSRTHTLATGFGELLMHDQSNPGWNKMETGAICYVFDSSRKKYSVRLIDPGLNNNTPCEKWRVFITKETDFEKRHPNLVTFALPEDVDLLYGLNFSYKEEAEAFFSCVQQSQNEILEKNKRSPLLTWWPPKSIHRHHKSADDVEECSTQENTSGSFSLEGEKAASPMSNERPKSVFSPFTERMDVAFNSFQNFVDSKTKGLRKNKKKKKSKLSKFDIGEPRNFQHKVHAGDSPFVLDDADVDETVRVVYDQLNWDYQKAPKTEIELVKTTVRNEMKRQSMRVKKAKPQNTNGPVLTSEFLPLSGARDSMHRKPLGAQRHTLGKVKRSNEFKRQESAKSLPSPVLPSKPPVPIKSPNLIKPALPKINGNAVLKHSLSHPDDLRPPIARKPQFDLKKKSEHGSATVTPFSERQAYFSASSTASNFAKQVEEKASVSKEVKKFTPGNLHCHQQEATLPPVPTSSPPPNLDFSPARISGFLPSPNSETPNRDMLLTEIRQANLSRLRKVDLSKKNVENPIKSGNLISIIGEVLKERRSQLAEYSDDDDESSTEYECSDGEAWDN